MPDLWEKKSDHGEGGWGSSSNSNNGWHKSSNGSWGNSSDEYSSVRSNYDSSTDYQARNNPAQENKQIADNFGIYNQRRLQKSQNSKSVNKLVLFLVILFFGSPFIAGTILIYRINHRDPLAEIRPELIKSQRLALEERKKQLEEEQIRRKVDAQQRSLEMELQAKQNAMQLASERAKRDNFKEPKRFSGYTKKELQASIVAQTGYLKQNVLLKRRKELKQMQAIEESQGVFIDYENKMLSTPDYDITIKSKQWEHTNGMKDAVAEYENDFLTINEGFIQTDLAFCFSHDPEFLFTTQEYRLTLSMAPNRPGISVLKLKEILPDDETNVDASIMSCISALASALYAPKHISTDSTLTLTLSANKVDKEKDIKLNSNEDKEVRNNTRRLEHTSTTWEFPPPLTEPKTDEDYAFLFGEKLDTFKRVILDCSKDRDVQERFKLTLAIAPQGGPIYITSTNYSNAECLYQDKELNMMRNTVALPFSTTASVSINYVLEGTPY